jgi:hypothetical protein
MKEYNIFKIAIIFIITGFLSVSCEDWLDINTDPNSPSESTMTENVYLPGIEATIIYELAGGFTARYPNYWMLQIGRDALGPDFATYDIDESDVNNTWTYTVYTNALKNAVKLTRLAEENGNLYYAGISKVISAYILAITADCWGSIPWSQAFQPLGYPTPEFDSQESVYNSIFGLLDDAIANFNAPEDQQDLLPGDEDYIYGGDVALWKKLAYTLKARFAMRLTYAPGKTGAAQADIVLASLSNGITSDNENPGITFESTSGAEAPWNQWWVKWESVYMWANEFMVNLMNSKNDPRRGVYFTEVDTGGFVGHRTGTLVPSIAYSDTNIISKFSDYILAPDQTVFLITYDEAKILEAEAYLWKSMFTEAKTALDEAITSNMTRLGVDIADIQAYIAGLGALPAGFESAQRMIIEEKYVINFLSTEVWSDFRRTGYPVMSSADIDNPTHTNIPLRFMYPADVKQNNPKNEPDVNWLTDHVWWDNK